MPIENETEWKAHIENLEKQTTTSTKEELKEAIIQAINKIIPKEKFGIFLSGGVDSSFIALMCKKLKGDFICYTSGLKGCPDLEWSKKLAKKIDLKHVTKEYLLEETEELFRNTAKLFQNPDPINVGVGAVVYSAAELARKDDVKKILGGLGSEEIFAGYQRHQEAKDKHGECWRGLKQMWTRDITRDRAIMKSLNFKAIAPFLEDEVIKKAMGIDINRKINETHKKIILREIAEELGLSKEFAWRQKKAAQYGSWFDKALNKLTKKNGFDRKGDYISSLIN